jgi:hypothetical protein
MSDTQNTQATEVEQTQVEAPQETAVEPRPEEDIFNDIFGDNSNEFAFHSGESEDVQEGEPSEVVQSVDPKEDSNQFQYWQSQADKRAAEVDLLKSQVSDLMAQKNTWKA